MTAALRRFVGDYRRAHSPTHHQDRVLDWLRACQTSALGGRVVECDSGCGWRTPGYNSCTDRHCPQCRGGRRADWLADRVEFTATAGGLRLDQQAWVETRNDYLFPTRVMAALSRGKVVEGLRRAFTAGELFIRGEQDHAEVAFESVIREA